MMLKPRINVRKLSYWHVAVVVALGLAYYLPTHWAVAVSTICNLVWMLED